MLFSKIVVALDGSATSEMALGQLANVLDASPSSEVILLQVVESPDEGAMLMSRTYLDHVSASLIQRWRSADLAAPIMHTQSIPIEDRPRNLLAGKRLIAEAIVHIVTRSGADLLILTGNGWSGEDRWLLGPVAEHVLALARTSVLLVRADHLHDLSRGRLRSILVPLDGSERAEHALGYARSIAERTRAESACLVHVRLPAGGPSNPALRPTDDFRPFPKGTPQEYLINVARGMSGVQFSVHTEIREGPPGPQIIAAATSSDADLIILASHGRSGRLAQAYGKVAEDIIHDAPVPVLIVHTGQGAPASVTG